MSIYDKPIEEHGGSKYLRLIYPADGKGEPIRVDVYSVIEAFGVVCPGRQQAIKKVLCAGLRGKGSQMDDLRGVFDAMWRALELQRQREAATVKEATVAMDYRAARAAGYEGEPCLNCGERRTVRNGYEWRCSACAAEGVIKKEN